MKTQVMSILVGIGLSVVSNMATAQSPSAENDYRRASSEARAKEALQEKALVKKLRTSIIPQFAKLEGMTAVKVDTPKLFSSTYFSHMTTADSRACRVQVNTSYYAFEFDDLQDMKSFFRPARAKLLVSLCGRERTKELAAHAGDTLKTLIDYAQTYGTDSEDYMKLQRLAIAGLNLSLNVYQNNCKLERWTISANCLPSRGDGVASRAILKSPKGILFDR